ncbi:MAG: fimbria/pilus outer membrane usher protein [Aestuariivirga sp.]
MMALFKPRRRLPRRTRFIAAALTTFLICVSPAALSAAGEGVPLQLEVSINGQALGLIGAFVQMPDGSLHATAGELAELGIKTTIADPMQLVALASLSGAAMRYDESAQSIDIRLEDAGRLSKVFDAQQTDGATAESSGMGIVLNYTAFASTTLGGEGSLADSSNASLTLDSRAYSPLGVLSNAVILGETEESDAGVLRLDTTWSYDHADWMIEASAGDVISGGLAWTRPVRIGGVQLRRNFGVRPDLITMPLPSASGSAAVPSTVDVYIGNVKAYSQDVPAGPWSIANIPAVTGRGEARIVVRDATGRETETVSDFIASSDLLRPGLTDFSAEAGVARESYGSKSFDYGQEPLASASLRHGLTDGLTAEAHAETGDGLLNGGAGLVAALGTFAIASFSAAASSYDDREGLQLYAGLDTEVFGVTINAATSRTFGEYSDLAFVISRDAASSAADLSDAEPAKAIDRISLGFQLPFDINGGFGLSGIHVETADGEENWIGTASYTRPLWGKSSLSVSSFADFGDSGNYGAFVFFSSPIGGWGYGSAGLTTSETGVSVSADVSKPRGDAPGSFGWRAEVREGDAPSYRAGASYRTTFADMEAGVSHAGGETLTTALADGALVFAEGGLFASRRVDDAFAVVDAGAPGVTVYHENRNVGRTGKSGKLLVTGLRAYEKNKIEIEVQDLPMDADFGETVAEPVPASRAGAKVDFAVKRGIEAAIVELVDSEGQPIAPGTEGTSAAGESFTVGYSGQAYLTKLMPRNVLTLATKYGPCTADFSSARQVSGVQAYIPGVVCK